MTNLLSHYSFIFSRKNRYLKRHLSYIPILDPNERLTDIERISKLFGASNFYDTIQNNLVHIYKRDYILDKNLFKFFFNIENILQ